MEKSKAEIIRSSVSFINAELLMAAQKRARQTEFKNLSAYVQRLILADLKLAGVDTDKIINA